MSYKFETRFRAEDIQNLWSFVERHRYLPVQNMVKHRWQLHERNEPEAFIVGVCESSTIIWTGKDSSLFHCKPQLILLLCDFYLNHWKGMKLLSMARQQASLNWDRFVAVSTVQVHYFKHQLTWHVFISPFFKFQFYTHSFFQRLLGKSFQQFKHERWWLLFGHQEFC